MSKKYFYEVMAYYPAELYPSYESEIIEKVGNSDASGMGLGERDHTYTRSTKRAAERIARQLNGLGLSRLKVERVRKVADGE